MSFSPQFRLLSEDKKTKARLGVLELRNGQVETPVFMPVGTYGTVRGLSTRDLESTKAQIMLCNNYHMVCRPGVNIIEKAGGLHAFNSWSKPILTDSGGFQVFSLGGHRKISDKGVSFKDPFNGETRFLSPENVIQSQEVFGSDVMMVLDECPPAQSTPSVLEEALRRTHLWAERSQEVWSRDDLALFSIIQGGCDLEFRQKSLAALLKIEKTKKVWSGMAIGGLSVGESKPDFIRSVHALRAKLPTDRPRYLMGVGSPRDLVFCVACGIDMFDCVIPSRNARHGIVMTRSEGKLNLFNQKYTEDFRPLDEKMDCWASREYSRSFLRHLFKIKENLAQSIATAHNIAYFHELMADIRQSIADGKFYDFAFDFLRDPSTAYLGKDAEIEVYPDQF